MVVCVCGVFSMDGGVFISVCILAFVMGVSLSP